MAQRLRPIGHEDRLSIVDHLDELRSRLIVCVSVLAVVFGVCFWQNSHLLNALNQPLKHLSTTAKDHISGITGDQVGERGHLLTAAGDLKQLGNSKTLAPADRALITAAGSQLEGAAEALPSKSPGPVPITIGVGEPFTVSLTVAFYFAILISIPVLLYEIYAFVVPAFNPREKAVALPIMVVAPLLFLAGVVFTYFIVLPPAIRFLQGYNAEQFQALVQAKPLYSFEVLTMGSVGLTFEMPLILLGLRAAGVINGRTLIKYWRYAAVVIAVIAAAMPGSDPVTTGLEAAPLVLLLIISMIVLKVADWRAAKREAAAQKQGMGDSRGMGDFS
jgi:sec-independent protein translocase protein TatC